MKTFLDMELPESLNHTLQHMNFNEPTPIQEQAIPVAIKGKDILGSAQTGTGKTAAFCIPLITKILLDPHNNSALVMTPTRELATQVIGQLRCMLGKKSKIKAALLIGGDSMSKQLQQLSQKPKIVVGTPGRINDHLKRKTLQLNKTNFLVLDETDRMLDMGFSIQIETILEYMPPKRQTLLFSATVPKNIEGLANKYLTNPTRITIDKNPTAATNIKQDNLKVKEHEKHDKLVEQLNAREGTILVFVKTKYSTERIAKKLKEIGHSADAIHGDLRQRNRDRVLRLFRDKKYRILVATDIAARGLDIPHIKHVINYDLPQCPEDYIHRIGRTARAGAIGHALNLIAPRDHQKWDAIDRFINPDDYQGQKQSKSFNKPSKPNKKRRRFRSSSEKQGLKQPSQKNKRKRYNRSKTAS